MKSANAVLALRRAALAAVWVAASLGALCNLPLAFAGAGEAAKPTGEMPGIGPRDSGAVHPGHGRDAHDGGHWMAPPTAAARANPIRADKASLARGKKIYTANCANCHGASGQGDGPAGKTLTPKPSDLAAMAPRHAAGDLAWKIENGRGAMPAWKNSLTSNQIWDVVNFLQTGVPSTTGGKSARDAHAGHAH